MTKFLGIRTVRWLSHGGSVPAVEKQFFNLENLITFKIISNPNYRAELFDSEGNQTHYEIHFIHGTVDTDWRSGVINRNTYTLLMGMVTNDA
jgi:hypothetical protein